MSTHWFEHGNTAIPVTDTATAFVWAQLHDVQYDRLLVDVRSIVREEIAAALKAQSEA